LEEEALRMLEEAEEPGGGIEEAEEPGGGIEEAEEPGDGTDAATLDPEVADALEEELFGAADAAEDAADAESAADEDCADVSETELFGPEAEDSTATAATKPVNTSSSVNEASATQASATETGFTDNLSNEAKEARRESDEGPYDSKTSRYMMDENGNLLHKWKVDYASRGGGGRAQCRDKDCLERFDQGGVLSIEKGCLRIGRRIMMDHDKDGNGNISFMWFHARCIFNSFLRARKSTRVIESEFDIEGFGNLKHEDQEGIRRLIAGIEKPSAARFNPGENMPNQTPAKRGNDGNTTAESAQKKPKKMEREPIVGHRVWTHFRCLPKEIPGQPPSVAAAASIKSEKPELAMIRDAAMGGNIIVQFESEDHEKERVELFQSRKGKRIRGWLRYPRLFEGRKQRVPVNWLQMKRDPPKLCGCKVQEWGHDCPCGIACGRGSTHKVWGVGDTAY